MPFAILKPSSSVVRHPALKKIDRANPLSTGLILYTDCSENGRFNIASGGRLDVMYIGSDRYGVFARKGDALATNGYYGGLALKRPISSLINTDEFSGMGIAAAMASTMSTTGNIICGNFGATIGVGVKFNSDRSFSAVVCDGYGTNLYVSSTTVAEVGKFYTVGFTYKKGGYLRLYINGVEEGTPASGTISAYRDILSSTGFGNYQPGYANLSSTESRHKLCAFWDGKELSAAEMASLAADPYQLIANASIPVVLSSAGGASYTGTGTQSQAAQAEALSSLLRFIASSTETQSPQSESSAALLRFLASGAASQLPQSEILAALLSFKGGSAQSQAANSEAIASILRFSGTGSQTQAAQTQFIYQAISAITGAITQAQAAQIAALAGSLAFGGASSQIQAAQSEALASVLRFTGSTTQAQAAQAEALQGLLAIRGQVTQAQAIQIAALTAIQILDITGTGTQTQEMQQQAVSDFVEELIAILSVSVRDPLTLTVTDSDPLTLNATVADPLALTITRTL